MVDFRNINGVVVPLNSGNSGYSDGYRQQTDNSTSSRASFLKSNALPEYLKPDYDSYFSCFVNPNAKCPKCDATVFYYESENGSKVYFDELGVPWTKHPCTDKANQAVSKTLKNRNSSFNWQKNKWQPFLFLDSHKADAYYTEIVGGVNGERLFLYIRKFEISDDFLQIFPIQVRCVDKHTYEFSTFSLNEIVDDYEVVEQKYIAFDSLRIARQEYSKGKRKISEVF